MSVMTISPLARETSDLAALKEWKAEALKCGNVMEIKILKIEEVYE